MEYKIDQSRRSGSDRRNTGARGSQDRRAIMADQGSYINIIQKIPLFKGLSLTQFREVLRICSHKVYRPDEIVIENGAESQEMFILIKGVFKVVLPDGKELSRLKPVEVVGEMGVFTGDNRSAAVISDEVSSALIIRKREMLHLFHRDSDLGVLVLTNVIRGLSQKVRQSNKLIDELKKAADSNDGIGKIFDDWDDKKEDG